MQRLARFVWSATSPSARAVRTTLVPLAATYERFMRVRAHAYTHGFMRSYRLGRPTVAVGGLSVGGAGKTPIASWIAAHFAARGVTPAILSRGYGGDEDAVHLRLVPSALVVSDPDRRQAARLAIERGAAVFVLDDAFQRLDVRRDLNICVISAEQLSGGSLALPAGPWREPPSAAQRADLTVITGKSVAPTELESFRQDLESVVGSRPLTAQLRISGFRPLCARHVLPPSSVRGCRVLASTGIGLPDAFEAQLVRLGAHVTRLRRRDHHPYSKRDVRVMLQNSTGVDYVVVTEKDVTKLEPLWPVRAAALLVAQLDVDWGNDYERVVSALDALIAHTGL